MATLTLSDEDFAATKVKTLTYHEDHAAGDLLKLEAGEDELLDQVPVGKTWDVQVTIRIHETDA